MEPTLGEALEKLFGKSPIRKKSKITQRGVEERTGTDLIKEANDVYSSILDSMKNSDWTSFGENFDKLGIVLNDLIES